MTGDGDAADADLEDAIAEIRLRLDSPSDDEDVAFETPWQARAFAVTVALRREGAFEWGDFQRRLVDELDGTPAGDEAGYYRAWLRAAERLLVETDVLDDEALGARGAEFAAGERDASEFVVGEHGHGHEHRHRHEHDRDQTDPPE
jgi:nitrile hydratase